VTGIPAGKNTSLLRNVQPGPGTLPASHSTGIGGSSPG